MEIHHLAKTNSVLSKFIWEIRSDQMQKDRLRFRRNIERIGEILGYELSKTLQYQSASVQTPLGTKEMSLLEDELVICSILRAGLPLHNGLLNYFDHASNAFISAYRKHKAGHQDDFDIVVEYLASPNIQDKVLLLADPMLATGQSLVSVFEVLHQQGLPKEIHIVSVIASEEGIDYVKKHFPDTTKLWVATVDSTLNAKGYIIPGLGDAGDLAYGDKL